MAGRRARTPSAIGKPVSGITGPATGTEEVTGEVELELAEVVLVVEEIGTLSTSPDPPPQETMKKVPTQAKEKGELKKFHRSFNNAILSSSGGWVSNKR